ncbi:hypothetical protein AAVH_17444 [Aphelenchoides avenae]|nr:hypothetical protein AAVH_17444 [Aphelenchus avenae]
MPLLEDVLLDVLQCLDRFGWDTLEVVSRALRNSVRASLNSSALVHYRRIDKVSCSGCDMALVIQVGETTYAFDVFKRNVFHYAFVNEFLIGSTSDQYLTAEFALALPNVVRTVAVGTLVFRELHICCWERNGDLCDEAADPSVFDGLVMSFDRVDRLSFVGKEITCVVKPDYMTDNFIRRCKLKGVRQLDAILCGTDAKGDGKDDAKRSSFDISPNAIVDFVSGSEGEDKEVIFKLGYFAHSISVLQRLILAFEQGRIPPRFRVALRGPNTQVRPAMREWYAACFTVEKTTPFGSVDTYHIPSVDFVVYVLDDILYIARHVDPNTHSWFFASSLGI